LTQELKHFVYSHRGFQYALPVGSVLEIVEIASLLPFHGNMPGTLGNMVHRQHLLPVLDATTLCTGLGPDPAHRLETVVVIQRDGVLCALALDRYITVIQLRPDAPDASGDSHRANTEDAVSTQPGPVNALVATDDREQIVETVLGFRNNSLIVLSAAALTRMVRERFGDQHILREEEDEGGPVEEVSDAAWNGYLCARIGGIVLGIPIEPVLEVIENFEVTPLFLVDSCLRGLINLRGQVLAVLDISEGLDLPLRTLEEVSQFIIVRAKEIEFALCVDKVVGQRRIRQEQIQSTESMITGEPARYMAGVHQSDSGPIFIISVSNILELTRLQPFLSQEA
jgi:purine-binding chemotaxis protein CheW